MKGVYRIIDANLNRAREALRVCEDIARFILNNRSLSAGLKSARHKIGAVVNGYPISQRELIDARDTRGDIGRARPYDKKHKRGAKAIFTANIRRSQESVRTLEEFSGIIGGGAQKTLKRIRFALYELEKKALERL